jgi:hypothetical protein
MKDGRWKEAANKQGRRASLKALLGTVCHFRMGHWVGGGGGGGRKTHRKAIYHMLYCEFSELRGCGPLGTGRRERSELRAAKPHAKQHSQHLTSYQQAAGGIMPPGPAAGGISPAPRRQIATGCADVLTPNSQSPPCGWFPEGPRTDPRVYSVRQRFSAPAHSTREGQIVRVWCFCRPLALFSAIAHSTSSSTGLLSISSLLSQVASRPVVFNALGVALAA